MDAYEFTRFTSDYTTKVKAQAYDINTLAFQIESAFNKQGKRYNDQPDYKDAHTVFIECTMSCTLDEAINWMLYFMENAIAYGIATKNRDWQGKFMAAWDLFNMLVEQREVE